MAPITVTFQALFLTGALVTCVASSASAAPFCEAQAAPYRDALDVKTGTALAEIDDAIAEVSKAGGDVTKIAVRMADGSFKTLPEMRAMMAAQKAMASTEIDYAVDKCLGDLKPFQDAADTLVTLGTGGLNKLVPERTFHVDIGWILSGKPFGSDSAFVPHLREQVLTALGLVHDRGFITKFVRDPLHAVFPNW
jgi:hypothetical protein